MRTLVLKEFGHLEVQDVPRPSPGGDQVLIRVSATGICGSDLHGFTGENGRRSPGQVMGHEAAGHIADLGADVDPKRYPVGAPVTFNPVVLPAGEAQDYRGREQHCPRKTVIGVAPEHPAAFADYVLVPARNVTRLSEGLPVHLGALIEPLAVSLHAVRIGRVDPEDDVLVLGGGPIGQSAVLALQMEGVSRILLSEPDAARRRLCEQLGAETFSPVEGDLPVQVRRRAPDGVAVVVDAVGTSSTTSDALRSLSLGGTLVLVGMGARELVLPAFAVSTEERVIKGSFTYSAQEFEEAAAWLGSHPERAWPLVSEVVDVEDAPAAFTRLAAGQGPAGKVLVAFAQIADDHAGEAGS